MSDGDICSDDEKYGGFGAAMANTLAANSTVPARAVGCGPIRTGEGAAAPFIGVHILGEIWPAGGFDTLAKLRWEDQIGPSILVQKINQITINHLRPLCVWRIGHGTERQPCLWQWKLGEIFDA